MRKTSLTVMAVCATMLWLGEAHAHFETHATNPKVPVGTVYDNTTHLLWEQKTGTVGGPRNFEDPHDVNNYYSWTANSMGGGVPNGTAFTEFLGTLNDATSLNGVKSTGCFANHCDWRLPEIEELRGIFDTKPSGCVAGTGIPCIGIDPIFGPTEGHEYWSATTGGADYPQIAWYLFFDGGAVTYDAKFNSHYVRAVRSDATRY
jgi:Protein of unknown function (DUF1566)